MKSLATFLIMGVPAWVILGGMFRFEPTSLLIHLDEPGVTVWVGESLWTATAKSVGPVEVKPGEYRVRVTRDGVPVFNRLVTVVPGERAEVWAHWVAKETAAIAQPVRELSAKNRRLPGHFGTVTGVGVALGNTLMLSVGADGTLRSWDATTGGVRRNIPAHVGPVAGMTILEDGRRIITAGDDGYIRVWDVETGAEVRSVLVDSATAIRGVATSIDGKLAAIATLAGNVHVIDLTTGKEIVQQGILPASINALAFSPDGGTLLVGVIGNIARDHRVEVWDARTGAVRRSLRGHAGPAWSLAFSPDGRRILTGGSDRTVRIWDAHDGRELARLTDHPGTVMALAVSRDGKHLLAANGHHWDGQAWLDAEAYGIQVWDLDRRIAVGRLETTGPLRSLAFSSDGRRAIAGGEDRNVHVWDLPEVSESELAGAETDAPMDGSDAG